MCKIFSLVLSKKNLSPVKTETNYVFAFQFLNDKIDQNTNFAKLPRDKWLFLYNCKFYHQKSNCLVCLSFLWRQVFLREQEKMFYTNSGPRGSLTCTTKRLKVLNGQKLKLYFGRSPLVCLRPIADTYAKNTNVVPYFRSFGL